MKSCILKFLICFAILFFCVSLPANAIKVGLYTHKFEAPLGTSGGGTISDYPSGRAIMILEPMKVYKLGRNTNGLTIAVDNKKYQIYSNSIIVKPYQKSFLFTKRSWYRGNFLVNNSSAGLTLINDVNLEDYLKGVVPSEMPASWSPEALKAQAIAARSYAMANLGKRAKYGYDLNDTTEDQVYRGASAETNKTNGLISETKGQVLVYGNKIIPAYYHASSGGHTLPSSAVWGRDLPFVRPVVAYDFNAPKNGHGIGMSQHGANTLAKAGYNAYQILGYFYQNVKLYYLQNY
jgi:stage II sporulation protein D